MRLILSLAKLQVVSFIYAKQNVTIFQPVFIDASMPIIVIILSHALIVDYAPAQLTHLHVFLANQQITNDDCNSLAHI